MLEKMAITIFATQIILFLLLLFALPALSRYKRVILFF